MNTARAELLRYHVPDGGGVARCEACEETWPCLVVSALGSSSVPSERELLLWRWCYSLALTAASAELALDNAKNREAGTPRSWPAQQEWRDLVGSSHGVFLNRVREQSGIDRGEFLALARGDRGEAFARIAEQLYERANSGRLPAPDAQPARLSGDAAGAAQ